MDGPASLGDLWVLAGAGVVALAGVLAWSWNALRVKANTDGVARLWESHNAEKDKLSTYKTEVAQTYVTKPDLSEIESRLTRHFDEKWADLKDDIRGLRRGRIEDR